jgi:hypothetical protein
VRQGGEFDHRREAVEFPARHRMAFLGEQYRLPRPART